MLLLGLHNVLLSKWTCFLQYIKVAPLHAVIVLVLLSTTFGCLRPFQDNTGSLAKGQVRISIVTSFMGVSTHLFTPTSVLPAEGPGLSDLSPFPGSEPLSQDETLEG